MGGAVLGIAAYAILQHNNIAFRILTLPLFEGRPPAPDYAVFSLIHVRDILNELFLVFPGCLVLLSLVLMKKDRKRTSRDRTVFLSWLALGTLMFFLLYGAAITMARDWDIMALSLFAPALLVLGQVDRRSEGLKPATVIAYCLTVLLGAGSFAAVATQRAPAEKRYYTLLNDRHRSGWAILADYYEDRGEAEKSKQIIDEMNTLFPEYVALDAAYKYLHANDISSARTLAQRILAENPYDPNFLRLAGNVHMRSGSLRGAEEYLLLAREIDPYRWDVLNDLGQLYMYRQQYDRAIEYLQDAYEISSSTNYITENLAWAYVQQGRYGEASTLADSLFAANSNSAGGHRIKMLVAVKTGDREKAEHHYEQFLIHGQQRPDYATVKERFSKLADGD